MHKTKTYLITAISSAAALTGGMLCTPLASAQDAVEDVLEEVVVTASRREEALQDVALSVAVLDTQKFMDAGLSNLADILPFVPGVSVGDSGTSSHNNSVYIRGVNAAGGAGVASYVDDIPFGSSTVYTSGSPLDGTLLDLGTLDVLKGPQGTLYGASAMGGILQFNTREASLEEWTGSISADLSTTKHGGLNQLYRINTNGPIVQETLALSFTAFWKDKTGYIDNVTIPVKGWDDYEYYGASGSLRWTPTEKLEIKLQGLYQNSTQDGVASIEANHADDTFMPDIAAGEPWHGKYKTGQAGTNPSEYEASLLGLTIDYDLSFGTLTSVTSSQEFYFLNSLDYTIPFAAYADLFFPENAPHTEAIFVGDLGHDKFTQELRLTSESNQNFEWIVGGFYTKEEGHNIQRLDLTPPDDLYYANFPSTYKESSLFATGTYYFTPDFDSSVGIRYTDYSNDVELETVGPLLAPLPYSKIEDDVTNWLFNLRYRSSDNMAFYGRIASGYRPGGANFVLVDPESNEPVTDPFFLPDSLWSYEVGMKGTSEDGRLSYDIAAFYIDWQDYQISVIRGGLAVIGNAEKAVSKGAEASLSYAVTDAFTIRGMLSYINAKLAADEPDLGGADGDRLPSSPKWQAGLDFDYSFDMEGLPAYVGASWRYKGDMVVGFEGYTDSDGVYWPPSTPRVELDSYNLVDLRAGFTVDKFDISFYVTNLLGEWAYTNFTSSFSSASLGVPTRPRTVGAVVRWNFF